MTTVVVDGAAVFEAQSKFREGETVNGQKIAMVKPRFERHMLAKTEAGVGPATLKLQRLRGALKHANVLEDLEGLKEISLTHLWKLMEKRLANPPWADLDVRWHFVAYVRDVDEVLCAVYADWSNHSGCGPGWYLDADVASDPDEHPYAVDREVVSM